MCPCWAIMTWWRCGWGVSWWWKAIPLLINGALLMSRSSLQCDHNLKVNQSYYSKHSSTHWVVSGVQGGGQDPELRFLWQRTLDGGTLGHEEECSRREDLQAVVAAVAPSAQPTLHYLLSNKSVVFIEDSQSWTWKWSFRYRTWVATSVLVLGCDDFGEAYSMLSVVSK